LFCKSCRAANKVAWRFSLVTQNCNHLLPHLPQLPLRAEKGRFDEGKCSGKSLLNVWGHLAQTPVNCFFRAATGALAWLNGLLTEKVLADQQRLFFETLGF